MPTPKSNNQSNTQSNIQSNSPINTESTSNITSQTTNRPDAFAAMRLPDFRRYVGASFLLTSSQLVQEVVVGYQLYSLTHDPLWLGLVGLAEALPYILVSLLGGHVADNNKKLPIMRAAMAAIGFGSLVLAWAYSTMGMAALGTTGLLILTYAIIAIEGLAKAFYTPAGFALKSFLVPERIYANAAAWSSSAWQAGSVLGPGMAGFLYAGLGIQHTLWLTTAAIVLAAIVQAGIAEPPMPARPTPEQREPIFKSLTAGIAFVWHTKPIFYSISLDLFSVLFGGVVAILPVFAADILHVGPEGLGILRAAPSIGAVLTLLALTRFAPKKQVWAKLLFAVAGFGLATIGFGLSTIFWLSVALLFCTGMFDAVSVVIRSTLLQGLTPPTMRGRVAAVNGIFISSSNELGAFESGMAARAFGTIPSVVGGGIVTLLVVGYMALNSKIMFQKGDGFMRGEA